MIALVCHGNDANLKEATALAEQHALDYSSDPQLVGVLGWIYSLTGRHESAETLLKQAIKLREPMTAEVSYYLAEHYARTGQTEIAQRFLQGALNGSPGLFLLRFRAEHPK